jgi:hypothetical protein
VITGQGVDRAGLAALLAAFTGAAMLSAGAPVAPPVPPPGPPPAREVPVVLPQSPGPVAALGRSRPVHLDLPTIGVHTALMSLGLNPDGTVEVPPLTRNAPAGWYRHLASPGEIGPAVLLGHVDSAADGPAVFFRLGALRPGDPLSVRRADGTTVVFSVDRVAAYPKSAFPTQAVYGAVDHPALRLVTCGGRFDRARGSYRGTVVVYAGLTRGPE